MIEQLLEEESQLEKRKKPKKKKKKKKIASGEGEGEGEDEAIGNGGSGSDTPSASVHANGNGTPEPDALQDSADTSAGTTSGSQPLTLHPPAVAKQQNGSAVAATTNGSNGGRVANGINVGDTGSQGMDLAEEMRLLASMGWGEEPLQPDDHVSDEEGFGLTEAEIQEFKV